MFNRIVVPIDGSDASWRAVSVGDRLAAACDAALELLHVDTSAGDPVDEQIERRIARMDWIGAPPTSTILHDRVDVAHAIADHLEGVNGGVLVMASSGRGRSQAVLGSVMSEVLAATFGPLIVVGPNVDPERAFAGTELIVTVDGSKFSETAVGLAGAWGIGMHLRPWVVAVAEPGAGAASHDALESNYVSHTAQRLSRRTRRDTEFEVLHDDHPARAINEFADTLGARFVVMSTHGRGGLARLALGSVAADVVRHAPCPVVLLRPPELFVHDGARSHAATV